MAGKNKICFGARDYVRPNIYREMWRLVSKVECKLEIECL